MITQGELQILKFILVLPFLLIKSEKNLRLKEIDYYTQYYMFILDCCKLFHSLFLLLGLVLHLGQFIKRSLSCNRDLGDERQRR